MSPDPHFRMTRISRISRLIEGWRKDTKLTPITRLAEWFRSGEEMGLGHYAESKILLHSVDPE